MKTKEETRLALQYKDITEVKRDTKIVLRIIINAGFKRKYREFSLDKKIWRASA